MEPLLPHINSPKDLKTLSVFDLERLAEELRTFILNALSVKKGHLGASLGVVELTLALHKYFNTPEDRLVWDVGHQTYGHKIITGRKDFTALREWGGLAGFPVRSESPYDAFGTGHSSTSISAVLGMAKANRLLGRKNRHIAVIGDASIVSGMAFEALNHLGATDLDVWVILNDNAIGIDASVGALKEHFKELTSKEKNLFSFFGLHYSGPIDGHDFDALFRSFEALNKVKGPKLLHIKTIKGKGYDLAEKDQVTWHAPGIFDVNSGKRNLASTKISYQEIFGETLLQMAKEDPKVVAISPAMLSGSHLLKMQKELPNQTIDVGIAEQHAVTLSAGLACEGMIPYCVVYSTFLQRAFDQVIHDVALQNLAVVFCVDRAGLVGGDGATHHGQYDLALLLSLPNMQVATPSNGEQLKALLIESKKIKQPLAIRFPRGNAPVKFKEKKEFKEFDLHSAIQRYSSTQKVALLYHGDIGNSFLALIEEENWIDLLNVYDFVFAKPLDEKTLRSFIEYDLVITLEESPLSGGFGTQVATYLAQNNFKGKWVSLAAPDVFISHGDKETLLDAHGIGKKDIKKLLISELKLLGILIK